MDKVTLVVMAAGIGSRFGGGIKQLAPVGPNGELIIDYSIYDAIEAGFNKIVFVIRKDLEKDFKEIIGNRIEQVVEVAYAYQEVSDIPVQFQEKFENRVKPWGTGQAVLACKEIVNEPFLVINSDDYYGKEAYRKAYAYLTQEIETQKELQVCMVGFELCNTLSSNGTVTRGVCKVDENHMLTEIEETYGIKGAGAYAVADKEGKEIQLALNCPVSMNMWGVPARFIDILEKGFSEFLEETNKEDLKREYLLPKIIGEMLREGEVQVKVLESSDRWFGVTYKEDREEVVKELQKLIESSIYPERLYDIEG